jgi:hypothetical protein
MLLSWPVIILISWFVIRFALALYEKKQAKLGNEGEQKT